MQANIAFNGIRRGAMACTAGAFSRPARNAMTGWLLTGKYEDRTYSPRKKEDSDE